MLIRNLVTGQNKERSGETEGIDEPRKAGQKKSPDMPRIFATYSE
jgi:hypothetical protein